jgi:hypothetical protein
MRARACLLAVLVLAPAWTEAQPTVVPTPAQFFGFAMGTDRQIAGWTDIERYVETVASASDRVRLVDAGATTEGRRLRGAIVTSPAHMARLEALRAASLRLAEPRALGVAEARDLAAGQPVVVMIGAGIEASGVGATQAAIELLHQMATGEDAHTRQILQEVVLILFPSLNPDGLAMVADWYSRTKETEFEGRPMPWLDHRYAGRLGRDAFMLNLPETRALARFTHREWVPQVFLSLREMGQYGARYLVPPPHDPIGAAAHPLVWRTAGLLGYAMALALEQEGRAGVLQSGVRDYYHPGDETLALHGRNVVGLLAEAASVDLATPVRFSPVELRGTPRGLPEHRGQVNFPHPWTGGAWRLRDIVDYHVTAARGLLAAAARYREDIVGNFYTMGREAVEAGSRGNPFAFILSPEQDDPLAAHRLRELLLDGGVEILRAAEPFRVADNIYPDGTDLILMEQPWRAYAKALLEAQVYPVPPRTLGEAPSPPSDVTGWTLPLQMGVRVDRFEQTFEPPLSARVTDTGVSPSRLWGEPRPNFYVIDGSGTGASLAANRLLAAGLDPEWTMRPFEVLGHTYPPGALIVPHSGRARDLVGTFVDELGLRATGVRGRTPDTHRIGRARVGLYKPWVASEDEGWTRWVLDRYEFPFRSLTDQDVRRGNLRAAYDVIVVPSLDAATLAEGHPPFSMPSDFVGGLGEEGARALEAFVRAGGTLVTLGASSRWAIEALELPVRDGLAGRPPTEFFGPGPLVRLDLDVTHPLAFGVRPDTAALLLEGSAFEPDGAPGRVRFVARYASEDVLLSGWLEGAALLAGRGAVAEVESGQGRVILFGIRPQHRGQTDATFRLLFNVIHTAGSPGRR